MTEQHDPLELMAQAFERELGLDKDSPSLLLTVKDGTVMGHVFQAFATLLLAREVRAMHINLARLGADLVGTLERNR